MKIGWMEGENSDDALRKYLETLSTPELEDMKRSLVDGMNQEGSWLLTNILLLLEERKCAIARTDAYKKAHLDEVIYGTLMGSLQEPYSMPGVTCIFTEAKIVKLYKQISDAYARLCLRLGVGEEDDDVEDILSAVMDIEEQIAYRMYRYGAQFGMPDTQWEEPLW